MKRLARTLIVVATAASLGGCYMWRPTELGPEPVKRARVTLPSAQELVIDSAYFARDSVIGVHDYARIAFPMDSVQRIEQPEFEWLVAAAVAGIVIVGWRCIYPGCG